MIAPTIWAGTPPLQPAPNGRGKTWARGYATGPDGTAYLDGEIGQFLATRDGRLSETAGLLNGCFAAVIERDNRTCVVMDRFGTVPVYIGSGRDGSLICSDDPWQVVRQLAAPPRLDPGGLNCMLHAGYVAGNGTLLENLRTAAPASVTTLENGELREKRYWAYAYDPEPMETTTAETELDEVLSGVMARMSALLARMDARPVLTLSGGLDSRLLAALFDRTAGIPPCSALSYGSDTDPEVAVAAEVATALSWPRATVPIDQTYFNPSFLETSVRQVGLTTRFTCGTGARHLQPEPGVALVPGHTGDFISGGHLPPHASLVGTRAQLRDFLDLRHFRYPFSDRLMRQILHTDRRDRFDGIGNTTADFDTGQDMFGLIDRWNVENRQRRLILMELRAYEAAGRWLLPFYDYALVDFFSRIPHHLRFGQQLYVQTALERVFTGEQAALGSIRRVGKPLRIDHETGRRHARFAGLPRALQTPLLRSWPLARSLKAWRAGPQETQVGPDPIKYWFRTDAGTRDFLTDKIRAVSLPQIDTDRLLALAIEGRVPEEFFHRTVTSAITAQESLAMAERDWRNAAGAGQEDHRVGGS